MKHKFLNEITVVRKQIILDLLKEGPTVVVFTKIDGTVRAMLCTLSESEIPIEAIPKTGATFNSETVIRVFDLENSVWKSFRIDNVLKISNDDVK